MQSILQLHLANESAKAEAPTPSKPENKDTQPPVMGKRLHQMVNRAAHKAASQYGSKSSGIFSK